MRRIKAREAMMFDVPAMFENGFEDEVLEIEFDDGLLVTNTRRTMLSWFCWKLHREYPRTPLYIRHHIGNDFMDAGTIPKTLSKIYKDLHYAHFGSGKVADHDSYYDREHVWKLIKDVGEDIYNVLSIELEEWHVSINAFHLSELFFYPPIEEIRKSIQPNQLSITSAYDRATQILSRDPDIAHNPIVQGLRSKQIKMAQFLQIIICRGYLTDIDQVIFRKPITVGFYEGLTMLHDIMIESCSAKKALLFTKKPLQTVEYFNRKMQLSTTVVDRLIWNDCGSERYAAIPIDRPILPHLEGKYYMDDDGKLKVIDLADSDRLVGRTLQIRSGMFCRHRGEAAVCHVCFGELAISVPRDTSLGHTSATELCREGSQRTLSVKHLDGSSEVEEIVIAEEYLPYIELCASGLEEGNEDVSGSSMIKFNPRIQVMKPVLIMAAGSDRNLENATNLSTLNPETEVAHLNVHRFTAFREIQVRITNLRDETTDVFIPVSQGARQASLSKPMLEYIRDNGYTVDEYGNYCVDLSGWTFAAPALSLPRRHASTLDFMAAVEAFIRSPSKKSERNGFDGRMLTGYADPVEALLDFSDLVNSQLWVHISHLEVILLSLMRPADSLDDYGLPDYDQPSKFEEHRVLMMNRSMGQYMAYERQPDAIEDPDSYLITKRPAGLLDPLLYPEIINT